MARGRASPTAAHAVLRAPRARRSSDLACASYPAVLKADGLAAGKGVIICADEAEAREAVEAFFVERRFGATEVVLEEFLEGEELSLLALCDGENVVPLAPAQDYKRIGDGDTGPNTGGMGSYSPVPGHRRRRAPTRSSTTVHRPIVDLMAGRGTPVPRRALRGPDADRRRPEGARVQLPLRRPRDPGRAAAAALRPARALPRARASRAASPVRDAEFADDWAVTVVLASAGYPASSLEGRRDRRARGGRASRASR